MTRKKCFMRKGFSTTSDSPRKFVKNQKNRKICGKSENSQKKWKLNIFKMKKFNLDQLSTDCTESIPSKNQLFFIFVVENGLKTINSVLRNNTDTSKIIQLNSKILADYNGLAPNFIYSEQNKSSLSKTKIKSTSKNISL